MRYKIFYITACCLSLGYLATKTMQTPDPAPARPSSPAQSVDSNFLSSEREESEQEEPMLEKTERFVKSIQKSLSSAEKNLKVFQDLINRTIISFRKSVTNEKLWTSNPQKSISYVQKLTVSPNDLIFIFGDIHGDSDALLNTLEKLIEDGVLNDQWELEEHNHIVFLGDYTDRGHSGVETWYILLKLLEANPDPSQVIVLRGNHESLNMNISSGEEPRKNGYFNELRKKFALPPYSHDQKTYNILTNFLYNCLPAALYITCNNERILCAHGGLDLGFNPQPLLSAPDQVLFMPIQKLERATEAAQLSPELRMALEKDLGTNALQDFIPKEPSDLHFLWSDFTDNHRTTINPRGAGWEIGSDLTRALLERDHIRCMIRGHQHSFDYIYTLEANKGFYSFEQSPIHTIISFSKIQDIPILCESYSFIKLEIGDTFNAWKAWHMRDGEEIPIQLASALAPEETLLSKPNRKRATPDKNTTQSTDQRVDELRAPEEYLGDSSAYSQEPKETDNSLRPNFENSLDKRARQE